jgi:hypothetical protein
MDNRTNVCSPCRAVWTDMPYYGLEQMTDCYICGEPCGDECEHACETCDDSGVVVVLDSSGDPQETKCPCRAEDSYDNYINI